MISVSSSESVSKKLTVCISFSSDGILDEAPAVERDFIRVPKIGSEGSD